MEGAGHRQEEAGCEDLQVEAGAGEEHRHRVVEGEEGEAEVVGLHRHPSSAGAEAGEEEVDHQNHREQVVASEVFCRSPVLEEPSAWLVRRLQT